MNLPRRLALVAAMALAYASPGFAGPCAPQIDAMQGRIDAWIEAAAARGKSARESNAATMNRQPTPKSLTEAEMKLGDIPAQTVQAVGDAMARARNADEAGDQTGCDQALADVAKALGK